jgi:hypothetical protein
VRLSRKSSHIDACHISAALISGFKKMFDYLQKMNIFLFTLTVNLSSAEERVTEMQKGLIIDLTVATTKR